MTAILKQHLLILESKTPNDVEFRKEMFGEPFWAERHGYRLTSSGAYEGLLMCFTISKGGYKRKFFRLR